MSALCFVTFVIGLCIGALAMLLVVSWHIRDARRTMEHAAAAFGELTDGIRDMTHDGAKR